MNFDDGWKFHFGHASDPAQDFNFGIAAIFSKSGKTDGTALANTFNDSSWRSLDLPHDWAVELPFANSENFDVQSHGYKPVGGLYPATSIGWYRRHFPAASRDSGVMYALQFDGVFRNAQFWINGFYLGRNESGYVGRSFEITDYLRYDADNVVTVRVDATQYEGWFYEGAGIYRHVWMDKTPPVHIAAGERFVHMKAKNSLQTVTTESKLVNETSKAVRLTAESYITDRDGVRMNTTSRNFVLGPNSEMSISQDNVLSKVRPWSIEDPYLYRATTRLLQNGRTIDSVTTRIGLRTIEIKADGVFLNGKYIKIKGTNNHQDAAGVGAAVPDYLNYYRLEKLQAMGCNAVRTSHNAPAPEFLDACDSLGMLVLDEQRLLNGSEEYMSQFERLIHRDRNHPSVFLWSIGNEEGWIQTTVTGKKIAQRLLSTLAKLDDTRTATYAADVANVFTGVNEVIPVRGFNYRQFAVADYHRDHPSQPIIGTEMGSTVTTRGIYKIDSLRSYLPDQDITAPWWASTAEAWWSLAGPNRYWLGGFIWTGFDYRGEPTPFQWPNISSHFGVMDICGFPKNIYYYYKSWWTDGDVLHISPHWNWKGNEGKPIDVWVNSNADDVELFLNGKSLGKKNMPLNGHLQWSVEYQPGRLEAVAHKKAREIRSVVETTGDAYAIKLQPSKRQLLKDGEDVVVVDITVVDVQGREVPDINQLLTFTLTGNGKIIGVGNGDPSSHERDRYDDQVATRSLFNGKCQVILKAGKGAGKLSLNVSAANLNASMLSWD